MSPGRHSQKKAAKWPFWFLLAAWWCANTPQAATFEVILWLKGAAYYSHQAELHDDVAALLSGTAKAVRSHRGQIGRETPPPAVPLAKTLAIKRASLCLHYERISPDGLRARVTMRRLHDQVPERRTSPPPLRPPRMA
jgi:hypothetical protein